MRRSLLKGIHNLNHPYKLLSKLSHTSESLLTLPNPDNETTQEHLEQWTLLFPSLVQGGLTTELAMQKASNLLNSGVRPDGQTLVYLVRASTEMSFDSFCRQLHCYVFKSGFVSNVFVSTSLMRYYRVVGSVDDAHKVFVEIPHPSVVSWNSLISGYVQSGQFGKGLSLFLRLERSNVCANEYSFTLALSACGRLGLLRLGRSVHCEIVKYGVDCGVVVENCLIDMYGKCNSVEEAILVFYEMNYKDTFSWNSVIAASARNRRLEFAYSFFSQMPKADTVSYNELINGISQFGDIEDAVHILSDMSNPNSSSWNSIITGYVNRNRVPEALVFFSDMHSSDVKMDMYTFSIILSGIAGLAALRWGSVIHACTVKCCLDTAVVVGTALIYMYSKCGQMENAESIFRALPMKNLITWNALFSGYAHNGNPQKVIQLFTELEKIKDVRPDGITFLNVIAACSNCGIPVQTAFKYFESMVNDYKIQPEVEHCCAMIRLIGQRGELWRAGQMINELDFGSCDLVWKVLLGACGACKDLKVATIAAAKMIELGADDDHLYVMMSNLYAFYGKWADVIKVRKVMRGRGLKKEVGSSWVEVEIAASRL